MFFSFDAFIQTTAKMSTIIGILPQQFVHILDLTTNVTKLEVGPQSLHLQNHEELVHGPLPFITIPPGYYCVIHNPCSNYVHGKKCELRLGYLDVRFHGEPFPLYPGEILEGANKFAVQSGIIDYKPAIKALPVVKANHAIRLKARMDHKDGKVQRKAGDMWQLEGPLTYKPVPEVDIRGIINPMVIQMGSAVLVRALQDFIDRDGNTRVSGEEWLVAKQGAYLQEVYSEVVEVRQAYTLTPNQALHLRALQTLTDALGKKRLAGDEWLVTSDDTDSYIPDVGVVLVKMVPRTVLSIGQYCVVLDPVDKRGKNKLGTKELRKGNCSFFLHPGESLETGAIQKAYILAVEEALLIKAVNKFTESDVMSKGKPITRNTGDRWMITGPLEYIPPIEVTVMDQRKAISLSKNEGIYVQDEQTGEVRAIMGPCSYMLKAYEVLWEKKLPDIVETMLKKGGGVGSGDIRKLAYFEQSIDPDILKGRNKTRVVTYRCPGNTAVQVYNYKDKTARVIFGPDLVVLGPHENFNYLSLSAGKPKKSDALQSLCLMLGPDFITDILEVETSDHARLRIQVAFNNYFEVERGNPVSEAAIFNVEDFIGFACRNIGSAIRGQVAQIPFDEFHKHSAEIIKASVFGIDEHGKIKKKLKFEVNNLVITNVDVQSIEPVDVKMRDSLSKSVQMAIEISTKSVEAAASHEAKRTEQIAKGQLERQKLLNEKQAEKERCRLYELQAVTAAVESTGQAQAEAQARAEKTLIECQSEIEAAKLKALAAEIEQNAALDAQEKLRASELSYTKTSNELEVEKMKALADIESNKFSSVVQTLGADTIAAVATSGPASQVNLLESLGIESMLITDGSNPINLFTTAAGLVSNAAMTE